MSMTLSTPFGSSLASFSACTTGFVVFSTIGSTISSSFALVSE